MVEKREPPFGLDIGFDEALRRFARTDPKELTEKPKTISRLAQRMPSKELAQKQSTLGLSIEKDTDIGGIGMGVLSDGTPYLSQRGLAAICGVMNTHIGTISSQWNEQDQKPRIKTIKGILTESGVTVSSPHMEIVYKGTTHFCYPAPVCLAILEYYALDAGGDRPEARRNFRLLAGSKLRELIYSHVGYDPSNPKRFDKWHERIALNFQSAPKGYFHVFNEAHTIIYELVQAGAPIGEKMIVDISIGQHWGPYWTENGLEQEFGPRQKYPHRYPDSHPQSRSNPQESWCYPLAALGAYRQWLQDTYIEGGKFSSYLKGKVSKGEMPPSVAQLAISIIVPTQIEGPEG